MKSEKADQPGGGGEGKGGREAGSREMDGSLPTWVANRIAKIGMC